MASAPDDGSLSLDQDTNRFLCRWGLNFRFLIQLSKTLLVELTRTHWPNRDVIVILLLLKNNETLTWGILKCSIQD